MTTIDETRLQEFIDRFAADLGAVMHASTVLIGDRLGLYRAMSDGTPLSPAELAERTGCDERYLREWLSAQAASGYAEYDPDTGAFHLSPEQVFALTSPDNPLFVPAGVQVAASMIHDVDLIAEAYRTGRGIGWGEHHPELFTGTERFFGANYIGNLVGSWIPALDGVESKLSSGAAVADVGCGRGASTMLLASAYPDSTFVGFDSHAASIDAARKKSAEAGLHNVTFETAHAKDYPAPGGEGAGYDLVCLFDCLHDMGDPVGAVSHVRETIDQDGTLMLVEPMAADRLEDNLNPEGRAYYSASSGICVPNSRTQEVDLALGAQAGEARLREVVTDGGFGSFRRAAETPFNLVFQARP